MNKKYQISIDAKIKNIIKTLIGKKYRGITFSNQRGILETAIKLLEDTIEKESKLKVINDYNNKINNKLDKYEKKQNKTGFVYFILSTNDNLMKIGWSSNPKKRFKHLQSVFPFPLILVAVMEGEIEDEYAIHKDMIKFRVKGEWFRNHLRLREYMEKRADIISDNKELLFKI